MKIIFHTKRAKPRLSNNKTKKRDTSKTIYLFELETMSCAVMEISEADSNRESMMKEIERALRRKTLTCVNMSFIKKSLPQCDKVWRADDENLEFKGFAGVVIEDKGTW